MSEHGIYTGKELIDLPLTLSQPLIDKLIWERDTVILVGKEKTGKSILGQQMAFSISSGEDFLSEYRTRKSCCLYIQVEGKLSDTRERVYNMTDGIEWEAHNFNLMFYPGLALNTKESLKLLISMIDNKMKDGMPEPKLIILDPLYMCIAGDLCDQEDATNMCRNLRELTDRYGSTLLIIHHEHKVRKNDKGEIIFEGDNSLFGSFVWRAFPDHILLLGRRQGGIRELSCSTQRSAKIESKIELTLIEPRPLMFEIRGDVLPFIRVVEIQFKDKEMAYSIPDLCGLTGLSGSSIKKALRYLTKDGKLGVVDGEYPKKWRLR